MKKFIAKRSKRGWYVYDNETKSHVISCADKNEADRYVKQLNKGAK